MDDFTSQVRQIAQYPDAGPFQPGDVLLLQRGGLNGPYKSLQPSGLFSYFGAGASLGIYPPTANHGLVASFLQTPLGARQGFNWFVDRDGFQRYLQNGVAGQWSFGDINELNFAIAPVGFKDDLIPCWQKLFALGFDGVGSFYEQLTVGRDPIAGNEVVTKNFLGHNSVVSFNGRTGAITLNGADLSAALGVPATDPLLSQSQIDALICQAIEDWYSIAPLVFTFNGRVGDIWLLATDVSWALFADPLHATAPNPGLGDASNRIATTLFVDESLADLYDQIQTDINQIVDLSAYAKLASPAFSGVPTAPTANPGTTTGQLATTAFVQNAVAASTAGVSSFNTRTGAVVLTLADVTAAGGAPLASPTFTGTPAGPTAAPGTNTTELATTAFVAAAVAAAGGGVTSFNTRTGAVTLVTADITGAGGAPIASPALTGTVTAPTPLAADNSTAVATTAFVKTAIAAITGVTSFNGRSGAVTLQANDVSAVGGALIASPTFTGVPAAPTAVAGTNTTQLATCAFVQAQIAASAAGVASFNSRTGVVTLTTADVTGAGGAPIASPVLTGTPAAPTPATADSSTTLATTAFVKNAIAATPLVASFNGRSGAVTLISADVSAAGGALIASPSFTGTPAAPTATAGTNTTQLATCAFVLANALTSFNGRTGAITLSSADLTGAGGALLASPTFTGTPNAPTPTAGTNNTTLATTAFVQAAIAGIGTGVASFNTRTGAVVLTSADVTNASRAPIRTVYNVAGSGTYPTPAGALYLDVEMAGAGGGGSNGNGAASGLPGGTTTFGSSFLTCSGGGVATGSPGAATGGDINIAGQVGGLYGNTADGATVAAGSPGAGSHYGPGGYGQNGGAGGNATSPGAGGGGGGTNSAVIGSNPGGAGGLSGAWLSKRITAPAASYPYSVGGGGVGASVGTTGYAGGRGADGIIIVDAYFQ